VGATFVMLWTPPESLTGVGLVAWMAVAVFLFYTAMTALVVPHNALGAELTTQYHDRTRVFGWRQASWHLGVLVALVSMTLLTGSDSPRTLASSQAWLAAAGMGVLLVVAVAGLRERADFQGRGAPHPYRAFADVWRNPHARLLLFVFLIESIGGAVVGVLTIYFSEYVLRTPEFTPVYIGVYFVAATVSVPVWIPLSRRLGKKSLWFGSMIATGIGFGATFALGPGQALWMIGIAAGLGLAAGCGNMVGPSIQADIIDWDEHATGQRKEGSYFAAWNFVYKAASGFTLGITGFVLQATGYAPNAEQGDGAVLAIRTLYAIFPLVCYAIGSTLFLRFSFNEAEYGRVRREIDERSS
jgi:GPH family glycoside/pentoside/hexuronide:cation symporter